MKPHVLREMSDDELFAKGQELESALMNLRFQKALSQLDKPIIMRATRRDYARVLTILRERSVMPSAKESPEHDQKKG